MKLVKMISTLSVAAAAAWMLVGAQSASQAQTVGVIGNQRLAPTVKLTIKTNGWFSNGVAQGSEYFGTASWNCSVPIKQLGFSKDGDGTKHVDALASGTFFDTVNYIATKANVESHFIQHIDGTQEVRVTITNAKTGAVLFTNTPNTNVQAVPTLLPGSAMDIEML